MMAQVEYLPLTWAMGAWIASVQVHLLVPGEVHRLRPSAQPFPPPLPVSSRVDRLGAVLVVVPVVWVVAVGDLDLR